MQIREATDITLLTYSRSQQYRDKLCENIDYTDYLITISVLLRDE